MILLAALIAIFIGLAHCFLGEKYILIRLFRQPLPKLFGDDTFTRRTLRFAWHLTSVAWWGFAAILTLLHFGLLSNSSLLYVIAITFGITGFVALAASGGKHVSWLFFGAIAVLCYIAAA